MHSHLLRVCLVGSAAFKIVPGESRGSGIIRKLKAHVVAREISSETVTVSLPGDQGQRTSAVLGEGQRIGAKGVLGVRPEHLLEDGVSDGDLTGKVLQQARLDKSDYRKQGISIPMHSATR